MHPSGFFARFARTVANAAGHPASFTVAVLAIAIWAATGPLFDFSDSWQLLVNSATTIATLLMVFLIQNTQNRDSDAMQIKLDELIRAMEGAHNALLDLEELEEKDIIRIKKLYKTLAETARSDLRKGRDDTGSGDVDLLEASARRTKRTASKRG